MFTSGLKDSRLCLLQVYKIQEYVYFRVKRFKNMFTSPTTVRATLPPPLELNLMATTVCFLKRPHPHSVFILCAWYTKWVPIPIKSHVLSLFLAFITLSDLYNPHHPPSEGCTFRRQKKRHFIHTGWSLLLMLSMITRGRVGRDMCCNFLNSYGSNYIYIHLNCKNLVFSSC